MFKIFYTISNHKLKVKTLKLHAECNIFEVNAFLKFFYRIMSGNYLKLCENSKENELVCLN